MGSEKHSDIFVQQIIQNRGILHKVCNIYCNTPDDKKDMMQEITLQLWKAFPNFRQEAKFSTWMYRIALNTAITNIRQSKKSAFMEAISDNVPDIPEKEDIPSLDEDINRLYKAIGKLNDIEKGIILLYLEKRTYAEIGDITGISEKNVSVKIVRIKAKLKKLLS